MTISSVFSLCAGDLEWFMGISQHGQQEVLMEGEEGMVRMFGPWIPLDLLFFSFAEFEHFVSVYCFPVSLQFA